MKTPRGLTVIEVLVILVVLMILLALLFPAVTSGPGSPQKATAQNDVVQIATALTAYRSEYGTWPAGASPTRHDVDETILPALMGTNARSIVFLEVNDYKRGKGGFSQGKFLDPWGNPYQYAAQTNDTWLLEIETGWPAGSGQVHATLKKPVAVWGQTNRRYTGQSSSRLPVASW